MTEYQTRVRYSETDRTGRLSMQGLLRLFQDANYFGIEDAGRGIGYQTAHRAAWFLLSWDVRLLSPPPLSAEVCVTSAFYARTGALAKKYMTLTAPDGALLATADTRWAFVDTDTGLPTPCPEDYFGKDTLQEIPPEIHGGSRIRAQETGEILSAFRVSPFLLDENDHVNNVRLTELALSLTHHDDGCRHVRAEFLRQSRLSDRLTPRLSSTQAGEAVLAFLAEDGKPNALFACQ